MDPKITAALDQSSAAIEDLLKYAADLEATNTALQSKLAAMEQRTIVLEKVAAEKPAPAVSQESVDSIVDELVSAGYFSSADGVKLAAELGKHPNNLVKLAHQLIRVNRPEREGAGVPKLSKSASEKEGPRGEWELDGWTNCFEG